MNQNSDLHDPLVLLQRVHRWRTAFIGMVILIAGITIGAGGLFIWQQQRQTPNKMRAVKKNNIRQSNTPTYPGWHVQSKKIDRHLSLSDKQYQQLTPIIKTHWQQLNKIKAQARPKIREQLSEMNRRVLEILNEKQKPKWRKSFRDLQQRFHLDYRQRPPQQTKKPSTGQKKEPAPKQKPAAPANQ